MSPPASATAARARAWPILGLLLAAVATSVGASAPDAATGEAARARTALATVETAPVPHSGDAADDAAIWIDERRPARSAIIATDKLGGLAVYDLRGRQLHYYEGTRPNNVDLRSGFPLGGRRVALVATSDSAADAIRLYAVVPQTRGLRDVSARTIETDIGVAGLCMYRSRVNGRFYVFVTDSSGTVQQWQAFATRGGRVDARRVRSFRLASTAEGCVADDDLGRLYVSEEDAAIWRYRAEPGGGSARATVDSVAGPRLDADIEGLALFRARRGAGYLIASSQGSDSFAVYERQARNAYVAEFVVRAGKIDGVTHTDGIEVTSAALGASFPDGLFIAQDDRDDRGNQNFKLVPWGRIARSGLPRLRVGRAALANRTSTRRPATPQAARGSTFYVDSSNGSDRDSGRSAATAWRTLERANGAPLNPGDRVLLRRGRTWEGGLAVSRSGTPARRIVVGAYGRGAKPIVRGGSRSRCVHLKGSHIVVAGIDIRACGWAGVEVSGDSNRIERCRIVANAAGIYVRKEATGTAIVRNVIDRNDKMSVLTPTPRDDDAGAFAILIHGDRTDVGSNVLSRSHAFSHDYGHDGAAVEIYGGRENRIHHNIAIDNDAFVELGEAGTADNTFSFNIVRSKLADSVFLVTRGAETSRGPVLRTRAYNNTVRLTGAGSEGFVCHAGCSRELLTLRNNIIVAAEKVGYADGPVDEAHDVFWGGRAQFTRGSNSVIADPRFVNARNGDLRLRKSSPAIDRGVRLGYRHDFAKRRTPVDGNGDGRAAPDAGAHEYQPRRSRR